MTDACWGDVFVVDVSHVPSEGDGDDDTSSCLPQRLAEGACAPKWSVEHGLLVSRSRWSCRVTLREMRFVVRCVVRDPRGV